MIDNVRAAWSQVWSENQDMITAKSGLLLRHSALDVLASVWEEDDGSFTVHVTAFVPGGGRVRLDDLSLWAGDKPFEATLRGDLVLRGLPNTRQYVLGLLPILTGASGD